MSASNNNHHDLLPETPVFVGLDIGGTKTEVLVVNAEWRILSQLRDVTSTTGPEILVAATQKLIYRALAQAGAAPGRVAGIGIGIPGQVDRETGVVRLAVNLNLASYPLGAAVTAEFNAPCFVENDVRAAALGVHRWLCQQQLVQHMAYLSVGTGVSAGVVLHGRLYRGAHGMAGEIGHIIVEPDGAICTCGAHGCLETIVAGPAIARQYTQEAVTVGLSAVAPTAESVFQAYQAGDSVACRVIQRVSLALSRAIQWLIMTYDVEKVVLGGGVVNAGSALLEPVLFALSQLRAQSDLARMMLLPDKLMTLPPDFNAGVWGAVMLAQQKREMNDW